MELLKPCPFCGGKPEAVQITKGSFGTYRLEYYVECNKCGSRTCDLCTARQASNKWNKRVDV